MFTRIRNRLTSLYTGIMALFLFAFVGISFVALTAAIGYELKQEIRLIGREEAEEQLELYKLQGKLAPIQESKIDENHDVRGMIFYYVLDNNGIVVDVDEPIPALRSIVQEKVLHWNLREGKTAIQRASLPDGSTAVFMMTAVRIYDGQQPLGTVYMGKDVTAYYVMLLRVLMILIGATLLFLVLLAVAGHVMAGRAIIPIENSFARQREFVADASHELRTPLSVLLTSVDVVQTDEDTKMSSFSQQVLADMKDEIRKMSKIIHNLLTLARADAGVMELFKEKFDLQPVAERVLRSLQTLAGRKGISMHLISPSPLIVYADQERLSQLLLILLDNAIKYTSELGEVILTIKIVTEANHPVLKISVQDTGIGIAPEHQELIFERFYRVDKVRSRGTGGTGLGLAIARWIVESHHGTIKVDSMHGKGSTFTVTIPNVVVN
jgi:two-component system sensor histidine kinase CiaH